MDTYKTPSVPCRLSPQRLLITLYRLLRGHTEFSWTYKAQLKLATACIQKDMPHDAMEASNYGHLGTAAVLWF